MSDNVLTVTGKRKVVSNETANGATTRFQSVELFSRSFTLPAPVDDEKVTTTLDGERLVIAIPKK